MPKNNEPIGFVFASGKNIAVNNKVLSNIKEKFNNEEKKIVKFKEIHDDSSNGLCEITANSIMQTNETKPKNQQPNAFGFAFASGKNIALDDRVLSNIKNKFQKEEKNVKLDEIDDTSLDGFHQTTTNSTIQSPKTPLMTSTPFVKKTLSVKSIAKNFLLTQYDEEIDYDEIDQVIRHLNFVIYFSFIDIFS